ncbi:MAG: hypothetical protein FJX77_02305 [Armatimonadetes bacterium]|nr:hypothetical protein [Armatimonadota bacterium]
MSQVEVTRREFLAGALLLASGAASQAAPEALPPAAEQIGEERYRVGKLIVDLKARTAITQGRLNMPIGSVEYLAVTRGGKVHESVLVLDVRPLHLQVGLILLGLEPRGGLRFQGDDRPPQGSPVAISVSWKRGKRSVRVPAEDLVWDLEKKRPMDRNPWIFSGWPAQQGAAADEELSLVATYRDPAAILNNALPTGADDSVYKVNQRVAPPRDTPVTVTFTPR